MSNDIYEPKDGNNPHIKNLDEYKDLYKQSINNPSKALFIIILIQTRGKLR